MISDSTLYTLSIFLGSLAMLLIILYHYLEVNARDDTTRDSPTKTGLADEKVGVGAVRVPPHSRNASAGASVNAGFEKSGRSEKERERETRQRVWVLQPARV